MGRRRSQHVCRALAEQRAVVVDRGGERARLSGGLPRTCSMSGGLKLPGRIGPVRRTRRRQGETARTQTGLRQPGQLKEENIPAPAQLLPAPSCGDDASWMWGVQDHQPPHPLRVAHRNRQATTPPQS